MMDDALSSHGSDSKALPQGESTMSPAMGQMEAYPAYLFRQISPCLGERVWEIGVGYGQYASMILSLGKNLLGTDIDEACLAQVQNRWNDHSRFQSLRVDLNERSWEATVCAYQPDSIVCLNVLEHIELDIEALVSMKRVVVEGASLGLVVPAHAWLYGLMDREAGHFRRYHRSMLQERLRKAGWHVKKLYYVNLVGALGWWYHNRWRTGAGLRDQSVNQQMTAMDRWLPRLARLTDPWSGKFAGLSLVAIAKASPD